MREIIFDIKDISDSREVMTRKAPPPIAWFLYIIITVIIIAIAFACIGEIDEYVRMTGEVRPQQPVSAIISTTGGKLTAINVTEGQIIKKGDLLFEFDKDSVLQQKEIIEKKYSEVQSDLECMITLRKSVESGKNLFEKDGEQSEYYYRYENYKVNLDSSIFQINNSMKDNEQSKSEGELSLNIIKDSIEKAQSELDSYSNLLYLLKKGESYTDETSNSLVYNSYKDYVARCSKANMMYQKSVTDYNNIKKKYDEQNNTSGASSIPTSSTTTTIPITKEDVENAKYVMDIALADIDAIKSSFVVQVDTTISQLTNQIRTLNNDNDKLNLSLKHLDDGTLDSKETTLSSEQLTRTKAKTDMIVSINDTIKSFETNIVSLDEQLVNVNQTIKNSGIVATTSGEVTFLQEINNGDVVQSGSQLLKIMPDEKELKVVLFVPENEIAKINIGDKVQYIVNSMPLNEYGKITGTVTSISADSFANEASGGKFYKAEAILDKTVAKNAKGEIREIKAGMITEARVISSSKKIILWLLQKINLID